MKLSVDSLACEKAVDASMVQVKMEFRRTIMLAKSPSIPAPMSVQSAAFLDLAIIPREAQTAITARITTIECILVGRKIV